MKSLLILLAIAFGAMMPTAQAGTGTGFTPRNHDLSRHHFRHYHRWSIHHHPNPVHIATPL